MFPVRGPLHTEGAKAIHMGTLYIPTQIVKKDQAAAHKAARSGAGHQRGSRCGRCAGMCGWALQ